MTNEKLIAENIKVKIQLADSRMSRLEAWADMERKDDPEGYKITCLQIEQLFGYIKALRELLEFPQLKNSK
jgi:hypothetical protein